MEGLDWSTWPTWDGLPYLPQPIATAVGGPLFAGLAIDLFLTGIAFGNFGKYLLTNNYRTDSRAHKVTLWAAIALLGVLTGVEAYLVVSRGVSQDRTGRGFGLSVVESIGPIVGALMATIVQSFLLFRAARLFKDQRIKRIFFILTGLTLILFTLLAGVVQAVISLATVHGDAARFLPLTIQIAAATCLWSSALVDVALSGALILSVRKHVLGFNVQTDNAIRRLINTAASTASYTAVCAVISAALCVAWPEDNPRSTTSLAFAIPLSAVYALSLLSTLAARRPVDRAPTGVASAGWAVSRASATASANGIAPGPGLGQTPGGPVGRRWSRLRQLSPLRGSTVGSQQGEAGPAIRLAKVKVRTTTVKDSLALLDEGPAALARRKLSERERAGNQHEGGPLPVPAAGAGEGEGESERRVGPQFLEIPGGA